MASWDDVRRIALGLPQTSEVTARENIRWRVADKLFVWERPLRKSDHAALGRLGRVAPDGPILGARVDHEGIKQALIDQDPEVFFTIPHFDGYPAVLVRLERIGLAELEELVTDAWLCRAPKRLADRFLSRDR